MAAKAKVAETAAPTDHVLVDPSEGRAPDFDHFTCANEYGFYCVPREFAGRDVPKLLRVGQVYEPKTLAFLRRMAKDGDIVSGGAFVGDFFPALSEVLTDGAELHSFEPNPISYQAALSTIGLNELTNVVMSQVAVGEKPATLPLQVVRGGKTAMAARAKIVHDPEKAGTIDVPVVTLDSLIPKSRNVSVLHLDIEGHEMQAILGAKALIKRCKPVIVLEASKPHRRKFYAQALGQLFGAANYQLSGIIEHNAIYMAHG